MLEIEKEEFENERRAKNLRIDLLENEASTLNEKLLILKMDFEERETKGQETEGRLKEKLKNISEELVALQKKRNKFFIESLEAESQIRRNSLKEHRIRKRSILQAKLEDKGTPRSPPQKENARANGNRAAPRPGEQGVKITINQQSPLKLEKRPQPSGETKEASECSIGKKGSDEELTLKRVGFGSTEKFEDKIDSHNREIYRKNLER